MHWGEHFRCKILLSTKKIYELLLNGYFDDVGKQKTDAFYTDITNQNI